MSEEIKEENTKKCECKGECIKIFLLGVTASFFGCLLALCLFSAVTKPKFPPPPMMMKRPMPMQQFNYGEFNPNQGMPRHFRGHRPNFHHGFDRPDMQRPFDGVKAPDKGKFSPRPDFRRENFKRFDGEPSPKM